MPCKARIDAPIIGPSHIMIKTDTLGKKIVINNEFKLVKGNKDIIQWTSPNILPNQSNSLVVFREKSKKTNDIP